MEDKKLTIKQLIKGKIGTKLNRVKQNEIQMPTVNGYTLVKDITPPYAPKTKKDRVGIYENKQGEKVVIKRVLYEVENLDAVYAKNEAQLLETFSKIRTKEKIFPEFIKSFREKNQIGIMTKYFEAKGVDALDKDVRMKQVMRAFSQLQNLAEYLKEKNNYSLPIRHPFLYLISFPLNLIQVITKDPSNTWIYLKLAYIFFTRYTRILIDKPALGLVHRDLYADNMLYSEKEKRVMITDWESGIISDPIYDIAQIAMLYTEEFGINTIIPFLQINLKNTAEKQRCIALAIFNSMQILAYHNPNHEAFKATNKFLGVLMTQIAPAILPKKSLFEVINGITLNAIYQFYKVMRLSTVSKNKMIILCYHSIGNNGWRFATRTSDFQAQMNYLNKQYPFVSLSDMIKRKKTGVHISFDDGYQDVIDNALPILEKYHVPATMFALSNYRKPNRKEMDNSLPIITNDQLKQLHRNGWEIGSHTATHSHLGKISDKQLEEEIIGSKQELEKNMGFPIEYFAYPKGVFSQKVIEYVKKAKYTAAFTVEGYDMHLKQQDPMRLSRIALDGELSLHQFEALLSPLGLRITAIFMKILITKENIQKNIKNNVS